MVDTTSNTHKLVVVLAKSLEPGPGLNAAAHMAAALVATADEARRSEMLFLDYTDADGNIHPVSGLSLVVLRARNSNQIRTARAAAQEKGLLQVDFTASMTGDTYREQMERTLQLPEEELDYWGLGLFGPVGEVNEVTGKFSLWR